MYGQIWCYASCDGNAGMQAYHAAADRLQLIPAAAKYASGVQFEVSLDRSGATASDIISVELKVPALPRSTSSCPALPCSTSSCPARLNLVLSYPALLYLVLPWPAPSCPAPALPCQTSHKAC